MPYYKDRERRKAHKLWVEALRWILSTARARSGLDADERIPDAVLLAEVEHYFKLPEVKSREVV